LSWNYNSAFPLFAERQKVTTIASVAMETQQLLRCTCGCQQYEAHFGLLLKYPLLLSDFHQIWGSSTDFVKYVNTNIHENPSRGSRASS
jgi:hypothetical protein